MPATTTQVRVRYKDTDTMSVVYYGNYLTYFEVGRVEFLRQHGLPMSEVNTRVHLPVVEACVKYVKPARLDDLNRAHTFVEDVDLAMDPNPLDTEVMPTTDGFAVKVTARSFARDVTLMADRAAADATVDDALVTLPAGHSATFRVRTSTRNLEQALDGPPVLRTDNDLQHT